MTDAEIALAREAVACKHWAWMPGMRMIDAVNGFNPCRVVTPSEGVRVTTTSHRLYRPAADAQDVPAWPDWLPDLSDPATVGGLEALVQRVLGHDGTSVVVEVRWTAGTHRVVRWRHRGHMGWSPTTIGGESHPSKVAAMVAALKAAP